MYRSAVILIMTLVLALLLLIVVAQTMVVVEMLATVDQCVGTAHVVRGGEMRPAKVGMLLRAGERVRTGADSSLGLHWADGTRIELGPHSEFVVERCRLNKARQRRHARFRLQLGEIWIRLRGALEPGSKFEVETPTLVAAVRGTIFSLKVSQDGTTELQVYRGQVNVSSRGGGQEIGSRRRAVIGRERFDVSALSEASEARWEMKADLLGPALWIADPPDDQVTSLPLAVVRGRTEPAARVTINGEPVAVGAKGAFHGRARLVPGANVITIVAIMGELRTTVHRGVTYVSPVREIVLTSRPVRDAGRQVAVEVTAVLRDDAGALVADGTPVEITADHGQVARHHRTERGAITTHWHPDPDHPTARLTAASGEIAASIMVAAPAAPPDN